VGQSKRLFCHGARKQSDMFEVLLVVYHKDSSRPLLPKPLAMFVPETHLHGEATYVTQHGSVHTLNLTNIQALAGENMYSNC
jgi:hypothetical protein